MRDVGFAPLEGCPYTESQGKRCARPHRKQAMLEGGKSPLQPIPGH